MGSGLQCSQIVFLAVVKVFDVFLIIIIIFFLVGPIWLPLFSLFLCMLIVSPLP